MELKNLSSMVIFEGHDLRDIWPDGRRSALQAKEQEHSDQLQEKSKIQPKKWSESMGSCSTPKRLMVFKINSRARNPRAPRADAQKKLTSSLFCDEYFSEV